MKEVIFFKQEYKLSDALSYFNIKEFSGKEIPIKLHMGEKKNKYFPRADFIKHVVNVLIKMKIKPYLFDTTVAYNGLRHTKEGYYKLAEQHGFSKNNIGCNVIIDKGLRKCYNMQDLS